MTTDHIPMDVVVLGALPGSSHTRGPWIARPDRDSPPAGGAVPLHDTPSQTEPRPNGGNSASATIGFPFIAESVNTDWSGPLLSPAATRPWVSLSASSWPSSASWRS